LAERHGVSPQRLVVAWLLAKGPHVLVIVGASRAASIEDSAALPTSGWMPATAPGSIRPRPDLPDGG